VYFLPTISRQPFLFFKHYIRGEWQRTGINAEGVFWSFRYVFEKNDFQIIGDPDYHVKGKYKILKEVENLLILHLFDIEGDQEAKDLVLSISVDKKRDQIAIENRVFKRAVA